MNAPPPAAATRRLNRATKVLIAFGVIVGMLLTAVVVLRMLNLLRPFSVPTGGMAPAVSSGDHVTMEGISFLRHSPRLGDPVVFSTSGMPRLPPGELYIKRVVGEPGDRVRIESGSLYVNDKRLHLTNSAGEISYLLPPQLQPSAAFLDVTVPARHYYLVGDNATNSYDSRFYGFVPATNIMGRVWFCYWPPKRWGKVK